MAGEVRPMPDSPPLDQKALAPCPFCGKQPNVVPDDSYGATIISCSCEMEPAVLVNVGEFDKAAAIWNRRAPLTALTRQSDEVAALREALENSRWKSETWRWVHRKDVIGPSVRVCNSCGGYGDHTWNGPIKHNSPCLAEFMDGNRAALSPQHEDGKK